MRRARQQVLVVLRDPRMTKWEVIPLLASLFCFYNTKATSKTLQRNSRLARGSSRLRSRIWANSI